MATILRSLNSSKMLKLMLVMLRGNINPDRKTMLKGVLKAVGTKHAGTMKKIVQELNAIKVVRHDVESDV